MKSNTKKKSLVREYAEALFIAALLALFIRTFIVQAFKIPSGSMLPTLKIGDHLLVNKLSYGLRVPVSGTILIPWNTPDRGDIIVFRYPKDRKVDYIKRVIGLPGETLEVKGKQVYINGKPIEDPHAHFIPQGSMRSMDDRRRDYGPVTVPKNSYFVMGDNRDNSSDSRFWGFVDQNDVLGKAIVLYWSWDIKEPLFSFARFSSIRWSRIGDPIH